MCVNMYLGTLGCTFVHVPAHVLVCSTCTPGCLVVSRFQNTWSTHTRVYVYLLGTFGLSQKLFSEQVRLKLFSDWSGVLGYLGTSLSI